MKTATKARVLWRMPEWMESYRALLPDYGLGVEDLMNDHDSQFDNNVYRAAVIIGLKEAIGLLTRLQKAGLLARVPSPSDSRTNNE